MNTDSSIVSSIYSSGAFYDLLWGTSPEYLAYWSSLVQRYGEPVLEIMCGTGLVAIPLAQEGYRVTGVDMAEPMLAQARRKSEAAGVDVEWVQGDARYFDLGQQFKLIYLPGNSISHLLTREDLEASLASVARHLHPEGRFAVSLFVPDLSMLMRTPDEEFPFSESVDPTTGDEIVMTQRSWYDAATHIKYNTLYKRVGQGPPLPDGELTMRMYFPQELDALFWYNGFAIEHKYSGVDCKPFDAQSTMQFYVLKARS